MTSVFRPVLQRPSEPVDERHVIVPAPSRSRVAVAGYTSLRPAPPVQEVAGFRLTVG